MTLLFWLLESAVRLTLLAALTAVVMSAFRVRNAETQFRVWTLVLLAGLALPFAPSLWVLPLAMDTMGPIADLRFPIQFAQSAMTDSQSPITASRFPIGDVSWLLVAYLAVSAFLVARIGIGWLWTARLIRSAHPVDGQTFLESARVEVPVTVGLFHPVIIVPTTWRSWPADTLAAVLAHEGDHAARRDGVWLTLGLLHRAVYWMNPLSWWLSRRLTVLSERASDDAALVQGVAPTRYAEILLSFATAVAAAHRRVAWVVPMARHSAPDTESRLLRILSWKGRAPMTRSRLLLLAAIVVAGSAIVYTATVSSLSTQAVPVPQQVIAFPAAPLPSATPEGTVQVPADSAPAPAPAPVTAPPSDDLPPQEPRGRGRGPGAPAAATPSQTLGVVEPVAVRMPSPKYTAEGMRAKIQGTVELEIEISATGEVTAARVVRSLDTVYGLDSSALDAAMKWTFRPKTIDDVAQASTAMVQMEFRLH